MKKNSLKHIAFAIVASGFLFISCNKKTEDPKPVIEEKKPVPPPEPIPVFQGNMENMVNDTSRISMIKSMMDYVRSANNGVKLDNNKLLAMFNNTNNPFFNTNLNAKTSVSISSAINPLYKDSLLAYFSRLTQASGTTATAVPGQAGILMNNQEINGVKYGRLFDFKGNAFDEMIEKNLAGAVQLYQMCAVYLSDDKITSSDSAQNLKNWDNAFAQLGVPLDYGNKDYDYQYPLWGKYLKINDKRLGGNIRNILNAFVKGRAAIMEKNNTSVLANSKIIKDEMERATAGMIMTSLNNVKYYDNLKYQQEKFKSVSSAIGFLHVMKNHPTRKIGDAKIDEFVNRLSADNWTMPISEINSILTEFSGIYGFNTTYDIKI